MVFGNFVSSIDGVVAFEPEVKQSAGRLLSGGDEADRYLLGLLRAVADAVVVGAGTARDEAEHQWTPEHASPGHAAEFAEVRRALGLPSEPQVYILSGSGKLDPGSRAARTSTLLTGRQDLRSVLAGLRDRGHRRILTEGGPRLMGGLLRAKLVDELFLTVSPVLAGRDGGGRPGLVEGFRALPDDPRPARLLSLRRAGDLLFLRYAFA
ncbi:MAG TPA: dihydrofolate reductase family protein [Candidatus Dormibacteraeota bacterium]